MVIILLFSSFPAKTQFYQLTEQDRKFLTTNFQVILNNIPTKFEKLKTGEEYVDPGQRVTWYKSKTTLFPNSPLQNNEHLSYGTWQGKPSVAFYDRVNLDVNTIVDLLMPSLKAKGMIEVNAKNAEYDPAARAFRGKDACLMLTYTESNNTATIVIGKIPFLYDSDVKPISATKPKIATTKTSDTQPEQISGSLTEPEKQNFLKNIDIVLSAAPGFDKLKTKNSIDTYNGSLVTANTMLFPNRLLDKGKSFIRVAHKMVFCESKENYFTEFTKANPVEIVQVLEPLLLKKGFVELETIHESKHFFFKVYRQKDIVVFVDKISEGAEGTEIQVGKICYYTDGNAKLKNPGKNTNSSSISNGTMFISQQDFDVLMDVTGKREQEKWIDKSVERAKQGAIQTTLPKVGKQRKYPVVFETDGKGTYLTTMILSAETADISKIKEEIIERIKNTESKYLTGSLFKRSYEIVQQSANDPILFNFNKYNDYDFLQFYLYKQQTGATQPSVMLAIKTIPVEVVNALIANNKTEATANARKNDPFCIKMQKLISFVTSQDYTELLPFTKPSGHANTYSFKQPYLPSFTTKTEIATIDAGKVYFSCYQEFKNNNEAFEFANKIDIQIKTCIGQEPSNLGNSVYYKIQTRNTKTNKDVNIGLSLEIIKAENSGEIPRVELRVSESYF